LARASPAWPSVRPGKMVFDRIVRGSNRKATKLKSFIGSLRSIFGRKAAPAVEVKGESRADLERRLIEIIARTQPDECTCEETYALIDQFTEALERGEDVSNLMPLVKSHLEICADCKEEFEALLRVVQALPTDPGVG
jgi:hypothetical protein